jgi:hypothetical protein
MTVLGGEPPIEWDALAPHIEHPARESIVEALRWIGPLSPPDLKGVLNDPELHLAYVAYHVTVLVREEVAIEVEQRPARASVEKLYFLGSRS